ncbi:MAG: DNA pilot protein [Microvirus sp.]|nr:MAG: DNA pilot protein [Microvirus sp.]
MGFDFGAAAGGIASGVLGYFGTKATNDANAQQAQIQNSFQAEMSNTAYQRAVADMQAAGLNPMLAYQQGGATTPAGAKAEMQNALGAATTSAQAGYKIGTEAQNQTDLAKADVVLKREQAAAAGSQEDLNRANMNLSLVKAANESSQLPGHKLFVDEVASQIKRNNALARQSSAQAAYTAATQPEAIAIGKTYTDAPGLKTGEKVGNIVRDVGVGASSAISAVRGKPTTNYRGQPQRPDVRSNQPPME